MPSSDSCDIEDIRSTDMTNMYWVCSVQNSEPGPQAVGEERQAVRKRKMQ